MVGGGTQSGSSQFCVKEILDKDHPYHYMWGSAILLCCAMLLLLMPAFHIFVKCKLFSFSVQEKSNGSTLFLYIC